MNPDFFTYIAQRQWTKEPQSRRRVYMHRLAQNSRHDKDFAGKIGGILIYNQVIEQYLADIITASLYYTRAKLWPVTAELDVDLEGATFGRIIEYFRQFATVEPNRDKILTYLKKFNVKRNQVAHELFDVEDLRELYDGLEQYAQLADEIIGLLDIYDDAVCQNFYHLEKSGVLREIKRK